MRHCLLARISLLAILALLALWFVAAQGTQATPRAFTFAAAGDHAANRDSTASLNLIVASGSSFYLALGDLSYSQLTPETAWCDYAKSKVGATFPFELVAGNHEDNGPDGLIDHFARCLPDRLGTISGIYAKEYYFDYPALSPTTRVILVSPNLTFTNGGAYAYTAGSTHYTWVASTIDQARAAGIQWIVVGMHKVCLSMGTKTCEIGADLMNLLISRQVDLVLQAHDHNYQRRKQLAQTAACPAVPVRTYKSSCVVDDGTDGAYTKGAGTVFVIAGTFGAGLYQINSSDAEAGYFASWIWLVPLSRPRNAENK